MGNELGCRSRENSSRLVSAYFHNTIMNEGEKGEILTEGIYDDPCVLNLAPVNRRDQEEPLSLH